MFLLSEADKYYPPITSPRQSLLHKHTENAVRIFEEEKIVKCHWNCWKKITRTEYEDFQETQELIILSNSNYSKQ